MLKLKFIIRFLYDFYIKSLRNCYYKFNTRLFISINNYIICEKTILLLLSYSDYNYEFRNY